LGSVETAYQVTPGYGPACSSTPSKDRAPRWYLDRLAHVARRPNAGAPVASFDLEGTFLYTAHRRSPALLLGHWAGTSAGAGPRQRRRKNVSATGRRWPPSRCGARARIAALLAADQTRTVDQFLYDYPWRGGDDGADGCIILEVIDDARGGCAVLGTHAAFVLLHWL